MNAPSTGEGLQEALVTRVRSDSSSEVQFIEEHGCMIVKGRSRTYI